MSPISLTTVEPLTIRKLIKWSLLLDPKENENVPKILLPVAAGVMVTQLEIMSVNALILVELAASVF